MCKIILFGGTTEGRVLAERLSSLRIPSLVLVATDYGEELLHVAPPCRVQAGRLDEPAMEALFASFDGLVLDATHPYAAAVSENIRRAASAAGRTCIRVRRESSDLKDALGFDSLAAMTDWLGNVPGTVFSSMGTKEAEALTAVPDFAERVWLRILPDEKNVAKCLSLGYPREHLVTELGPFSKEQNLRHFAACGARILLTKESGRAGGFSEKLEAAAELGMTTAVLRRPQDSAGISLSEALELLEKMRIS